MRTKLNILKFSSIFLISILFLSIIVAAAGTGSGGSSGSDSEGDTNSTNDDSTSTTDDDSDSISTNNKTRDTTKINRTINSTKLQLRKIAELKDYNCEEFENRTQRIKCRLMNMNFTEKYNKDNNIIPEACRLAENRGRCVALYRTTQTCYKLEGRAKDACFKRAIGLRKAHFNETQNYTNRSQHAREYAIILLYNLEEKVEKQLENGNITEDEAAQLIDKITEIKGLILNRGTKTEVRIKMAELRNLWRQFIDE